MVEACSGGLAVTSLGVAYLGVACLGVACLGGVAYLRDRPGVTMHPAQPDWTF